MKKTTLLMLTLMMSVFAFAQEIQQIPQPGLKKQLTLKQQILNAKREGKQLNKETIAQFNVRKPATSQLAKMKKQHSLNIPVQKMEGKSPKQVATKKAVASPTMAPRLTDARESFTSMLSFAKRRSNRAEEVDANGIITSPGEGTVKVYSLAGYGYQYSGGNVSSVEQSGTTKIVETTDGVVYIQNFISTYATGAWVKGTRAGNTITVPAKQPLNYNSNYNATISARWAKPSGNTYVAADETAENFTLTVDDAANTITLEGTSEELLIAALWDDDNSWTGNAVWQTVYTYSKDYEEPTSITVTPPAGMEVATWYTKGHTYSSGSTSGFKGTVSVGFAGDEVYIQGMFSDFPEAWMKGTIEGTKVTFAGLQVQGTYGNFTIYATGGDNTGLIDYEMTYDAENGILSSENALFANAAEDRIYYLTYITDIQITKDEPAQPITPPEELQAEDWFFAGYFYDGESESPVEKTLKVGAIDKDVYVQGISYFMPEAWIKGTLSEDGKSITFASGQYYGAYNDTYDMWFAAVDAEFNYLESVTVPFDSENGTITWPEDAYIIENGEPDMAYAYGYYYWIEAIIKGTAPAVNEVPVGLEFAEWGLKSQTYVQDDETGEEGFEEYNYHVQVGIAENTVYVLGYYEDEPDAVLKGTLDPETNKVTFTAGQCIGQTVVGIDWNTWSLIYAPIYFDGESEEGFEDVVMTYNAETQTLTQESPTYMVVNGAWLLYDEYVIQKEVTIAAIPDIAAVPAQPEIVKSSFSGSYPSVSVDIPVEAADGSDILTDKLYYQYWTEIDGVQTPLTLDPSEYSRLSEPMTEIPYTFTDNYDIYSYRLYLNQDFSTWKKIGIQSIYRGGEAENKSEISWKTIANLSVDPEFDSSKGGIAIQTKALEGEKVVVTVAPLNGYKVTKVTARVGKTYIKVDEEEDEDGNIVYSVIVPPADVIVNAEFDVTPADFTVNVVPGDLTAQIDAATAGMIVRGLNIQMEAGEYTMTKPIEAGGDINIAGNGSIIDASGIVGGEDGSVSAPFIQLSTTPQVDFIEKYDGSGPTDYYGVAQVAIRDVTVKGLKNSIFWDNNTKYCVGEVLIENSYFQLATEAVQNEALISFQAGGAKEINIRNNTFAGNNAVAKYFIRYNNSARLDRYGYNTATDYMIMGYVNNTFVNLLIADGQWGNYSAISGQKYVAFNVEKNIWWNCGKQIIRRMCGGRMNGSNPQNFKNNTYFNEGVDESAGEVNYDQSGTILTSDPHFENLDELKLAVRNKTEQALNETGDWNRWGEWIVDVYDITIDIAEDANGTVKAPANAQEGELITLEVVPAEGYRLVEGSLEVFIGKSQIELGENNEFNMPAADVTVKAQFELIPTFAITVAEGIENGTVVADKQEAAEGDVVTLTITPAEGFELDYITVTGVNTNVAVPVENNKFTMPADAVNINAAFKATATGILAVELDKLENATIYTLQGVRVEKAQKGVFIVNGKKTVIK